jgi:hypothetical protein
MWYHICVTYVPHMCHICAHICATYVLTYVPHMCHICEICGQAEVRKFWVDLANMNFKCIYLVKDATLHCWRHHILKIEYLFSYNHHRT